MDVLRSPLMSPPPQFLPAALLALFVQLSVCAWSIQPAAKCSSTTPPTRVESDENSSEEDLILGFRGKSK